MSTHSSILHAAEIIKEVDPQLADEFVNKPFQRHSLVTAFHQSLLKSQFAEMADEISTMLRSAIDMAQKSNAELVTKVSKDYPHEFGGFPIGE